MAGWQLENLVKQAKGKVSKFLKARSPMSPKRKKMKRAEPPKEKISVNLREVANRAKKRNKKVKSMLDEAGDI